MKEYLWTLDGGRIHYQSSSAQDLNWIFIPGGPGLGSEALSGLTTLLSTKIPGTIWHFDFPNDGSNNLDNKSLFNWRSSLLQAITALDKVVLVAHSTPGMYVQSMPELEEMVEGLVLIGSAPHALWQELFAKHCQIHSDATIKTAEENYLQNPSNESLRDLLIAAASYCFVSAKSLVDGKDLFRKLPINQKAYALSEQIFDTENYRASWVPKRVPTLIITGDKDCITPLELFQKSKDYQRSTVTLQKITNAGHYPWFENSIEVIKAFKKFSKTLF